MLSIAMNTSILSAVTAAGLSLNLLVAKEVNAVSYTYTKIADTSSGFGSFGFSPAINNKGTVAFNAVTAPRETGVEGIFIGSGGAITTIVNNRSTIPNSNSSFVNFGFPAINDKGTVAFQAYLATESSVDETTGIFTSNGKKITTIAGTSGPFSFVVYPTINNKDTVAFVANLKAGGSGIFTNSDGEITTIADTNGPFSSFGVGGNEPTINNKGTVAFEAELKAGGDGIFTDSNGEITTIADTSDLFSNVTTPAINNNNTVAFAAALKAGGTGLFTGNGRETTSTASDSRGVSLDFPAINNKGTVAFLRTSGNVSDSAIFSFSNRVTSKVIAYGDPLFGSTVTGIDFYNKGLNNSGQIAFFAQLANGTSGIFRADPIAVLEPSSTTGT